MSNQTGETPMNSHARYLRLAAKDIADAGHNGWSNTCTWAATEIDRLESQLSERDAELKDMRLLAATAVAHRGGCIYIDTGNCDCGAIERGIARLKERT